MPATHNQPSSVTASVLALTLLVTPEFSRTIVNSADDGSAPTKAPLPRIDKEGPAKNTAKNANSNIAKAPLPHTDNGPAPAKAPLPNIVKAPLPNTETNTEHQWLDKLVHLTKANSLGIDAATFLAHKTDLSLNINELTKLLISPKGLKIEDLMICDHLARKRLFVTPADGSLLSIEERKEWITLQRSMIDFKGAVLSRLLDITKKDSALQEILATSIEDLSVSLARKPGINDPIPDVTEYANQVALNTLIDHVAGMFGETISPYSLECVLKEPKELLDRLLAKENASPGFIKKWSTSICKRIDGPIGHQRLQALCTWLLPALVSHETNISVTDNQNIKIPTFNPILQKELGPLYAFELRNAINSDSSWQNRQFIAALLGEGFKHSDFRNNLADRLLKHGLDPAIELANIPTREQLDSASVNDLLLEHFRLSLLYARSGDIKILDLLAGGTISALRNRNNPSHEDQVNLDKLMARVVDNSLTPCLITSANFASDPTCKADTDLVQRLIKESMTLNTYARVVPCIPELWGIHAACLDKISLPDPPAQNSEIRTILKNIFFVGFKRSSVFIELAERPTYPGIFSQYWKDSIEQRLEGKDPKDLTELERNAIEKSASTRLENGRLSFGEGFLETTYRLNGGYFSLASNAYSPESFTVSIATFQKRTTTEGLSTLEVIGLTKDEIKKLAKPK